MSYWEIEPPAEDIEAMLTAVADDDAALAAALDAEQSRAGTEPEETSGVTEHDRPSAAHGARAASGTSTLGTAPRALSVDCDAIPAPSAAGDG